MRKYYVIEISVGSTKIAGKAIYEYGTYEEAVATFHKKLDTAMSSELYESDLVMVIDDNGAVLRTEKYTKPQPDVEPEVEPDNGDWNL